MDSYTEHLFNENQKLKSALRDILKVLRPQQDRKKGMKHEIREIIYSQLNKQPIEQ
jgi:hypothetical protein